MLKKLIITIAMSASLFVGSLAILPAYSYAASGPAECSNNGFLGLPTWYKYLELGAKGNDTCAIIGPAEKNLKGEESFSLQKGLPRIGMAVAEILLRVAGMVAVAYVILGGFKYMTSQGEPDGLKAAQGTIINALIGLAISVMSTVIVTVIGNALW